MDDPLYDRDLDALPAEPGPAKADGPPPGASKSGPPTQGGPGIGHYAALGIVGGMLATSPLCILSVHGEETLGYLFFGLLFAAPFLWAYRRDLPFWGSLFRLATVLLFLGLDAVLLGLVTRRPELTGWIHVGPQAVGAAVCLAALAATDGWRAALAELVTAPAGVACGNVAVVMMGSGRGKQPGEAMVTIAALIFAGLIFAYIPFQGFVERARMLPNPPRPRAGKPPVVDLEAKG